MEEGKKVPCWSTEEPDVDAWHGRFFCQAIFCWWMQHISFCFIFLFECLNKREMPLPPVGLIFIFRSWHLVSSPSSPPPLLLPHFSSPHHLISVMITLCLADLRWCNYIFWHRALPSPSVIFCSLSVNCSLAPSLPTLDIFLKGLNLSYCISQQPLSGGWGVRGEWDEGGREFGNVPRWFCAPVLWL